MNNPENGVALITGAGSGIGRAAALVFAQEGAKVVVADISVEDGRETTRLIEQAGGESLFVETDVSQAKQVGAMVDRALEAFGRIDYAVNNAGIEGIQATTVDYTEETWRRVIAINLTGVWLCMKYEIPQMLKQGKGAIVNMSSIFGRVATPQTAAYTASKHAVIGLTKVAALGVRCPGHSG